MGPVSVYRVGALGADPSYFFGGEAPLSDLRDIAWVGWLPLTLVQFAGPGVALTDDTWLTAPAGSSECPRRPVVGVVGDVVSPLDAARELIARRNSGLTAFTDCPGDVLSDGPIFASSLAVLVADDLAAHVDRLRTAFFAVAEALAAVEQGPLALNASRSRSVPDSPVRRRYGRAVRDLQDEQIRLHVVLDAAVRIGVFAPAALSREPPGGDRLA